LIYFVVPLIFNILLGFIFYKKQLKVKNPVWTYRTDRLIGKRENFEFNIPVFSDNNGLCYVSITRVIFFNCGSEPIKKEDIMKDITITFPKDEIILLEPKILLSSRPEICLTATYDNKKIIIAFKFLDQGDGGVIEIIHSSQRKVRPAFYPITGRPYLDRIRSTNDFPEYGFIKNTNDTLTVHAENFEPRLSFRWKDVPGKDNKNLLSYESFYYFLGF